MPHSLPPGHTASLMSPILDALNSLWVPLAGLVGVTAWFYRLYGGLETRIALLEQAKDAHQKDLAATNAALLEQKRDGTAVQRETNAALRDIRDLLAAYQATASNLAGQVETLVKLHDGKR